MEKRAKILALAADKFGRDQLWWLLERTPFGDPAMAVANVHDAIAALRRGRFDAAVIDGERMNVRSLLQEAGIRTSNIVVVNCPRPVMVRAKVKMVLGLDIQILPHLAIWEFVPAMRSALNGRFVR